MKFIEHPIKYLKWGFKMQNAEFFINKLLDFYNVTTVKELSNNMKIGQPSISKWKINNSVNAIKKKCRELGIYKEIFENTKDSENPLSYQISKEDINAKLFLFKRRSLVYIYYLLQKEHINNALDYFHWQEQKEESSMFKKFINDIWHDTENDNISFSGYRNETDQYISNFIKIEELDYIFENKDIFIKSIIFMTNETK